MCRSKTFRLMNSQYLACAIPTIACAIFSSMPARAECGASIAASVLQWTVEEHAASGRRLVRESGWLPGVELRDSCSRSGWRVFGTAAFHGGSIDYQGQTQFGTPLNSTTGTHLIRLATGLDREIGKSLALFTQIEWFRWTRDIRGGGNVAGLNERSDSWHLAIGARKTPFQTGIGMISADAAVLLSTPENVQVDFSGILDPASLRTKPGVGIRLHGGWKRDPMSPIELVVAFDALRVPQSDPVPAFKHNAFAGTISQPEHDLRSISASLRYHF